MLRSLLNGDASVPELLIYALAILLSLMAHESCHALAAYWLGDPTAKQRGRVSANPLRHVDPVGALMLLMFGFGWAKPVPVDPRYFKNPKRDMALTAAAGPASNFLLAFVSLIVYNIIWRLGSGQAAYWFGMFFMYSTLINVGLGVFNLFPIPPLDGSKLFGALLPDKAYYALMRVERYGMLILMAVLAFGFLDTPLYTLRQGVLNGLDVAAQFLTGWIGGS